jgi:SAM-dependent MidA family methyltransferase
LDVERWTLKTTSGNPALVEFIRDEIERRGPVSFAWFMEQALYHPGHGYYSSGRATIGRKGDYFTNVSVGPVFGQLLAAQFIEMWQKLGNSASRTDSSGGEIDNFTIVEQGAHDGAFARDVLTAIRQKSPVFFSILRYRIVEPFTILQDRQSQTLQEFGDRVQWRQALNELEPFTGIHFSNELLDAMPMDLRDRSVGLDGENFVFLDKNAKTETKPAVFDWIDNLAPKLERGFVIAIDYGFPRAEFRDVVQTRAQHRHLDSPFEQIGEADITAHLNWTEIAERAEAKGLHVTGFTDQHHFITGIISELMRDEFSKLDVAPATKRALQTLLHPEMLGRAFQVLALNKDVDLTTPVAGFRFARDPRGALGIEPQ